MYKKIAFLFPGQGSQYVQMGKDFYENFPQARETFEEADDLLGRKLSKIVLEGPQDILTQTHHSQPAIYVVSIAILRCLQLAFPKLKPHACAGLSLGEYTALHSSGRISFAEGLKLVENRGQWMSQACESTKGTMAVVLGLQADEVEKLIQELNMPNDLWVANYNCPGQVVISGTLKGIEKGTTAALAKGAKRVLPLQVHGAFHSGLMRSAEEKLKEYISQVYLGESAIHLIMNVTGDAIKDQTEIKRLLTRQITSPVRWEQSIRFLMTPLHTDLFIEIGCGRTLSGFNKRIDSSVPTYNLEKISDLSQLEEILK